MGFFRLLAWVFVALGLALIGHDGMSTLEAGGEPVINTTAEVLNTLGMNIEARQDAEGAMGKVSGFFLNAPLWALIGGLGVIMTLIFRPLD